MKDLPFHSSWAKNRDQKCVRDMSQEKDANAIQTTPDCQRSPASTSAARRLLRGTGPPSVCRRPCPLRRRPFSRLFPGKRPISPARPPLGSKRPIPTCFNYRSTCPGRNGWFLMAIEGDFRSTRLPEIGGFVPASARHFPMT